MTINSYSVTSLCPLIEGHRFLITLYTLIHLKTAWIGHFVQSTKALMINEGREKGTENKAGRGRIKQSVWGWRPEPGWDTEMPFGNQTVNNNAFKVSTCITFYCFCITEVIRWRPYTAVIHILGNAPLHRSIHLCYTMELLECCCISRTFSWTES